MSEVNHYRCYYKREFPVDEYGRPGGFYSLADLPIVKHDVLSRQGIVEAKNEEHQMYRVRDWNDRWEFWIPMADVALGEIIEDENTTD